MHPTVADTKVPDSQTQNVSLLQQAAAAAAYKSPGRSLPCARLKPQAYSDANPQLKVQLRYGTTHANLNCCVSLMRSVISFQLMGKRRFDLLCLSGSREQRLKWQLSSAYTETQLWHT